MRRISMRVMFSAPVLAWLLYSAALAQDPSFYARRDYPDINAGAGFLGDFNGDGIPDVAVRPVTPDLVCGLGVQTHFGNGDGSFRPGPCSALLALQDQDFLFRPLTADVNRDGRLDLVFGMQNFRTVRVALGVGDGTFTTSTEAPGIDDIVDLTVTDVDGDGNLDIAVATFHDSVEVAFGRGDGTFGSPVVTRLANPLGLAAVDLNLDGKPDLVVGAESSTRVLLGRGDGTFERGQWVPAGCYGLISATTADFNQDGLADVAVGCWAKEATVHPYVAVYLNRGDGTVGVGSVTEINGVVNHIAVGEVSGDGRLDVVAIGGASTGFVLLGRGDGTLNAPYSYPLSFIPSWVALADLRGTGIADMVVTNAGADTWSVLLNDGRGRFADGIQVSVRPFISCAATRDLNRDGKADVAVATSIGVQILYGTGRAREPFLQGALLPTPYPSYYVAVADFNNDGLADVAAATWNPLDSLYRIFIFLGQGGGRFVYSASYEAGTRFLGAMLAADLNHDHTADLIAASGVMLANGDGTFQTFLEFPTQPLFSAGNLDFRPAVRDFDGDGHVDVATFTDHPGTFDATLVLFRGNGDGSFQAPVTFADYLGDFAASADFNRDGIADLVLGNHDFRGFNLLLGNGDGTFRLGDSVQLFDFSVGEVVSGTVGDFNGDGNLDVVFTDNRGYEVIIALGNGDGTFARPEYPWEFGTGPSPTCILAGQFHDAATPGKLDVLTVNDGGTLTLLVNTTQ